MLSERRPFRHLLDPAFAACHDPTAVTDTALDIALKLMGTELGNVQLATWGERAELRIVSEKGFTERFLACFQQVTLSDGSACGRALLQRRTVVIEDVFQDEEFSPFWDVAAHAGFRSVQSTPLLSSSGALLGVLSTHAAGAHRPSDEQMRCLTTLVRAAANAIIRLRVLERQRRDHAAKY